jgi:hypothetical protein
MELPPDERPEQCGNPLNNRQQPLASSRPEILIPGKTWRDIQAILA